MEENNNDKIENQEEKTLGNHLDNAIDKVDDALEDVFDEGKQKNISRCSWHSAGGFGVHKFVLGYNKEGIIQIIITIFTCGIGSIIGLIEGIIYLTKSDEEFINTYQKGHKGWF